jgi:hypothetical protein
MTSTNYFSRNPFQPLPESELVHTVDFVDIGKKIPAKLHLNANFRTGNTINFID